MRVVASVKDEDLRRHVGRLRASTMRLVCFLSHVIVLLAVVAGCRSTNPRMGDVESGDTRRVAPPPRTKNELERDRNEALRLFYEGRRLVNAGDPAAACPVFEKSRDLDPGAGTLYHLADCYVRLGKTASAYELFTEVVDLSKKANRPDREKLASDRMKALEPQLSRLTILAPWVAPTAAFTIVRNGQYVPRTDWGRDVPVNPGSYNITANMQGFEPWNKVFDVNKPGATIEAAIPQSVHEWRPTTMRHLSPKMMGFGIASISVGAIMLPIGGKLCGTASEYGAVGTCVSGGIQAIVVGSALVIGGITFTLVGARDVPVSDDVKKKIHNARLHVGPGSIGFSGSF
jgi:hypothetical protein